MATEFKYIDYSCELKFGEHVFNVPLNEQTAQLIDSALGAHVVPPEFKGIEDIDRFYNALMDGIDAVLGEGAADKIMSRFAHAGTMEALSVVKFIVFQWRDEYSALVDELKKTTPANREQRRAANRR